MKRLALVAALMLAAGAPGVFGQQQGSEQDQQQLMQRMQERMEQMKSRMEGSQWWSHSSSSGNSAFDEYKAETLKRREEEQREFKEFLRRLRMSKDRAEFDQFMNERRNAGGGRAPEPQT